MAEVIAQTLFITSHGAFVGVEGETIVVEVDGSKVLQLPAHLIESIACLGRSTLSHSALALCGERGIPVSFLSQSGRFLARLDAPTSGNVLLRREQFRRADDPGQSHAIAKRFVAGKLTNGRHFLARQARESQSCQAQVAFREAIQEIDRMRALADESATLDALRGYEGNAGKAYFGALGHAVRSQTEGFAFSKRTRRPPLDRFNCLISFLYALMLHDCSAGLYAAGFDPSVGFLHADRPGRPSLALDLLEEFRTLVCDRLAVAMVNQKQVTPDDFDIRTGGSVWLKDNPRKTVVKAYQRRKDEEAVHPFLQTRCRVGQLPFLQARLLARYLRGDIEQYPPCIIR